MTQATIDDSVPDKPVRAGAIVPVVTGATADHVGLSLAPLVPGASYVLIALYGLLAHSQQKLRDAPVPATP